MADIEKENVAPEEELEEVDVISTGCLNESHIKQASRYHQDLKK